MLRLEQLSCGYGDMRAVHRLDLEVPAGGLIRPCWGPTGPANRRPSCASPDSWPSIRGASCTGRRIFHTPAPWRASATGIALVPEGRRFSRGSTVKENLIVGGYIRPLAVSKTHIEQVLALFPRLSGRLDQIAGSLSGGEQQMLAIGRALMSDPQLLLVDELSLGLMPKIIDVCYEALTRLKETGLTIVLVEQNTRRALEVADQVCILESGHRVWYGTAADAAANPELTDVFLGIKTTDNQ